MGFFDIFRKLSFRREVRQWRELGGYESTFTAFGNDVWKSDLVRACIRPLVEFTVKAEPHCSDDSIERILDVRPNLYMTGRDFLQKVRTRYEIYNNVFIFIERNDRGKVVGFYPVPYSRLEALEYQNGLFIKFWFKGSTKTTVLPWEDLAVIRKDYAESDIVGDRNTAVLKTLELINTTHQGMANAIKATANLRGILKSTKAMLSPESVKEQRDQFVRDYLSLENSGGVASLDATQEFQPIKMEPVVATYEQLREFREDIYRYFGVNEKIVTNAMTSDEIEAFYETTIEPFLCKLSAALFAKTFTPREMGFGAFLVYEANKLQFASLDKKISVFKEVVQYGGMTINEWRKACNMAPLPGGDTPIMRLDAAPVNNLPDKEGEGNA